MNELTIMDARERAKEFIESGYLPKSVNSVAKAVNIMQKGKELGMQPLEAFAHVHVIDGKPTLSAEAMLSLILRKCPDAKIQFLELSNTVCKLKASRTNYGETVFIWTMEDAQRAGLAHKDNWKRYPRAMLRSRAVSEMARTMFADALSGVSYTPEELQARVVLNEQGETVEVQTLEAASVPVEIYDGLPQQDQSVKTILRGHGLEYEKSKGFLESLRGKPMRDVLMAIENAAKRRAEAN